VVAASAVRDAVAAPLARLQRTPKTPRFVGSDCQAARNQAYFYAEAIVNNPDLLAVVEAWPTLPEAIQAGILTMVRAAGG
jgi:hypothetical protein